MREVTVAELQSLEEKIKGMVGEMPGPGDALAWTILETEFHEMYTDLGDVGKRSVGEVEWQVFNARHFVLEAIRRCETRKQTAKHAAGEAVYCLDRAWHMLQNGNVNS